MKLNDLSIIKLSKDNLSINLSINREVIIHLQPFFNHLKLTLSFTQTKIKLFYCIKFVIAPVKGFPLVRETQECTTFDIPLLASSFISQEKVNEKVPQI